MPLAVHLLFGAIITALIHPLGLGLFLAFASHYALDALPHWDYSIENIKSKKWNNAFPDFAKIFFDVFPVLAIIFIVSKNPYLLLGAVLAGLPDILMFSNWIFPNKILLFLDEKIHNKTHYPEQKTRLCLRALVTFLIFILAFYVLFTATVNSPLTGSFSTLSKTSLNGPR